MIRLTYANTLEMEEAGGDEVVLHSYDSHPDA